MSSTMTPMIPGLSLAAANPRSIHRLRGSPQYLMWPALNFSVRCRCPVSFPAITTRQPFAPASMIRRTVEWPARRKCQPRSRAFASFSAIICALSAGLPTSWTSICGLSNLNWRSTASVILFSRALRVRDGALEDLEEPLRRFDGIPGGPRSGFVGHPSIVFPHRHGLFQGNHGLQVFARLVNGLPPQLSRQLDGLLPREREVSAIGSSHRLDLVFDRVPAFRHRPHFSGMNFDERVAPTPGPLWTTAFRVIANSPM